MNYLKKLPERKKDPETCCGSVKEGKKYINPVSFFFFFFFFFFIYNNYLFIYYINLINYKLKVNK